MPEQTANYLVHALNLGSLRAANLIAERHERGEFLPIAPEHTLQLRQAAEQGDVESQVALGRLMAAGMDGTPNLEAAHSWFSRAAHADHPHAQAWMGDCYRLGLLDSPDPESAEHWYRRAAAQSHIGALLLLAEALSVSQTETPEVHAEIFGLWLAAASAGNAVAQRNVGLCYLSGSGCPIDPRAGVRWIESAAEQDDPIAKYELSECYRKGRGTSMDLDKARYWLDRASENGYADASVGAP